MIRYRNLSRNPFDELLHRGIFAAYSMLTTIIPYSVELRTYFTVLLESIANLAKWCFRPAEEANHTIDELIREFGSSYNEPTDKVAIITGGTSGLGKVMAKAVAKAGFHVILRTSIILHIW